MNKKAKVGAGSHPPFDDSMAKVDKAKTSYTDDLPDRFTHKLHSTRAKDLSSTDPRIAQASGIWDYRDKHINAFGDKSRDRLSKGIKVSGDKAQWHGGVAKDGTHRTQDCPSCDTE